MTPTLLYDVDHRPPLALLWLLGLQHFMVLAAAGLAFPLVVGQVIGLPLDQTAQFISLTLLGGGLATMLQSLHRGPVGSGFLIPSIAGPAWLPASIMAVKAGGMPLLAGMTLLTGLLAAPLARLLPRLRMLFPPEVTGTVTMMVGVSLVPTAVRNLLGLELPHGPEHSATVITGLVTLAVFVAVGAWGGQSRLRLYVPLLAFAVGFTTAWLTGLLELNDLTPLAHTSMLALPRPAPWGFAFSWELAVPFGVAALGSALKGLGDITASQRANDPHWQRMEINSATGGVVANAVGVAGSGLLGTMGTQTYSLNVGLALATGATSRTIGLACGGLMVLASLLPQLAMLFTLTPAPVIGAMLVFAAAFMIVTGMQIVCTRMLDMRKTLVVALPVIFALDVGFDHAFLSHMPEALHPFFSSSLSTATVLVVGLNFLLHLGVARRASTCLNRGEGAGAQLHAFLEERGGEWGARREVIEQARIVLTELLESIQRQGLNHSPVTLEARLDEMRLSAWLRYRGRPLTLDRPRPDPEKLHEPAALEDLAAHIIQTTAHHLKVTQQGDDVVVTIHLDH